MKSLRFQSEREEAAWRIHSKRGVASHTPVTDTDGVMHASAKVRDGDKTYETSVSQDRDGRLVAGSCTCSRYIRSKLSKGPCEHMLAMRMRMDTLRKRAARKGG